MKYKQGSIPHGSMVFLEQRKPYWVIMWQANNGPGCYWLIDAGGNYATP